MGLVCAHIVVAEDDEKQAELIRRYLTREQHSVTVVHDGRAALDQVRQRMPDLLVLDVMLPVVDGLDVCRILRRESGIAVLMLTARSTEDDILLGLDLGADDYMTKPFSPRELTTRVRTLLRRTGHLSAQAGDPVLRLGTLVVDPARHEVRCDGVLLTCTPGEFRILAAMAAAPGRVFTREELLKRIHGFGSYITERTVDTHVLNLRKKIESDPRRPLRLVTVHGVGYKLADPATADETR